MEIIITEKGKNKGRVSVTRTLSTLQKNETWTTTAADVDPFYIRVACSKLYKTTGREFTVTNTRDMGNTITITRIA